MTFTQAQRTDMHQVLREKLSVTAADTLLEHLPPQGWSDVATKTDILLLKTDLELFKSDLVLLEHRLNANITKAIASQNKWMTGILASLVIAMIVALFR